MTASSLTRRSWLQQGVFAVLDQGSYAGANFLLNVALARWLVGEAYGAFALTYAILLLMGAIYQGFLTEPMIVFGAGRFSDRYSDYLGVLLTLHFKITVPAGLGLIGIGIVSGLMGSPVSAMAFIGAGLSSPLLLLVWFSRRIFYVRAQPWISALGGFIYLVAQMGGIVILRANLNSLTAYLVICASSVIAGAYLVLKAKLRFGQDPEFSRSVLLEHWRYGKWAMGTAVVSWFPSNVYYVALPLFGVGFGVVGALKGLMNILAPVQQLVYATSAVLLPTVTRLARAKSESKRLSGVMRVAYGLFVVGGVLFWAGVAIYRDVIMGLLYGDRFESVSPLLLIAGGIPLVSSLIAMSSLSLKATEHSDKVFLGTLAGSALSLVVGLPLAVVWELQGAILSQLLTVTVSAGALWMIQLRLKRSHD